MPVTFIWRNSKNGGNGNFQEGFRHYTNLIKIGHGKVLEVSIQMN